MQTDCLHCANWRFNSQPPEGGWGSPICWQARMSGFNSQPPEGGWFDSCENTC